MMKGIKRNQVSKEYLLVSELVRATKSLYWFKAKRFTRKELYFIVPDSDSFSLSS